MKAAIIKQDFEKLYSSQEVRVYKEKGGIVKDKRLEGEQFDYDEVLNGRGLDDIIDRIQSKLV